MWAWSSSRWRSLISSPASWVPGIGRLLPRPARSYAQARTVRPSGACTSRQLSVLPPNPASKTTVGAPEPTQPDDLEGATVITASALLDMLTRDELHRM